MITKLILEFAGFTRVEHRSYPKYAVPDMFSIAVPTYAALAVPLVEVGESPPFRRLDFRLDYVSEDTAYYRWDGRDTL